MRIIFVAMKKRMIVLTGAGMSAESGIPTFRAVDGLWENHNIKDVASPDGWSRDPKMVLDFYNQRRKNVHEVEPNRGHEILAEMQMDFDVHIITQNIDNLHERAGSKSVMHLHGEITKSRSTLNQSLVYDIEGTELNWGDKCELGSQLRPHIVWFGESVPMIESAAGLTATAEIFVVIGTSLQVYPAAGLLQYAPPFSQKYIIDPNADEMELESNMKAIVDGAGSGLAKLLLMIVK